MTIANIFTQALLDHWAAPRYQRSGWTKEIQGLYSRNLDVSLGSKTLTSLTPKKVKAWHRGMKKKPTEANRALSLLSRLFTYAQEEELIDLERTNPCSLVKRFKTGSRRRHSTEDELISILRILERERSSHPREVLFLEMILYTGARPSSIERMRLKDIEFIDHEGERYGFYEFKGKGSADSGELESVVLPPVIVKELMQLISNGSLMVTGKFIEKRKSSVLPIEPKLKNRINPKTVLGIKTPARFWNRIRKEVGCEDLWIRDFRRTFASVGLAENVGIGVISELLNHKSEQTSKIYARLDIGPRLKAVAKIADKIERLAG